MRWRLLIALLLGATMPLAFAPFSWWPVAIFAPALLIFQLKAMQRPWQAFWLGVGFGMGYFGLGVYWLYHSLHVYGYAPVPLAVALTLLMIVTLSLFIGGALAACRAIQNRYHQPWSIWSLPPIWFAMEWFKGWVLTGFPWLSVGYAHIHSPLSGFAPVIGVYGLGLLSLSVSLLLVLWYQHKKPWYPLAVLAIGVTGYALQHIDWTHIAGDPLKITMVQGNVDQAKKWRRDERVKIIKTYWQATQQHWDADLVVWPEAAIPGRSEDMQDVLIPMAKEARAHDSNLLTGIIVSDWLKREYYNSMLLMGNNEGVYHKRHLVLFGEYYPFRDLLDFMRAYIRIPMSDMSPGPEQQPLMSVNDVKLGVSICYEDVFSRDINRDLPEANILVNTSNDTWFGDSLAPHQHLEIAQMRALETGRPLVRSTNTGPSAFIDNKGRIVSATEQFKIQTLTSELQGRTGRTPFLAFAKFQPWLAFIILGSMLILIFKPSKP